jgi:hypothetical protein
VLSKFQIDFRSFLRQDLLQDPLCLLKKRFGKKTWKPFKEGRLFLFEVFCSNDTQCSFPDNFSSNGR